MTISLQASGLVGFLLAMARSTAWVFVSPPFAGGSIPARVRIGLAAALALPVAPRLADQAIPLDVPSLVVATATQVAIGLVLGFVAVVIFAAIQAAGAMIDLTGGFAMAQVFDPQSGAETSLFGRYYNLLAVTLLFAIDGHLLLVRGFITSFEAVGPAGLAAGPISELLTDGLGLLLLAALEIAAPVLAALFLTDVALGLLARAAPQMQVFLLGLPLKLLLTVVLLAVALPMLPEAAMGLIERIIGDGLTAVGAR